ncbi:carboxypeptidase-like regulatory domain-containing protein [Bacteroidia bacterium]|jgi:hypothetical protein|nr:carboxypeptidase-like regulatory domain-containing protein [Bacteroidia bacterium]
MRNKLFVLFAFLAPAFIVNAQNRDTGLIEFSGLVLTSDSLYPISYVYVFEKNTRQGDVSDGNGFFALTARKGDTIVFNGMEYKQSYYIIPDTLKQSKYNIIKLLTQDTNYLQPVVIYPLPPRLQFDYIFVKTEIPDDDLELARKNLKRENLRQEALAGKQDAKSAYSQEMKRQADNLYWKGQLPPNNLLNPVSWQKFFQAWQRGDYKKKKKTKKN